MYFFNTQTQSVSRGVPVALNMGWHFPSPGEPVFNGGYVPLHLLKPTENEAVEHYRSVVHRRRTDTEYARMLALRPELIRSEILSRAGIRADLTSPVESGSVLAEIWLHFDSIAMYVDTEPQVAPELLPAARRIMRRPGPGYVHKDVIVQIQVHAGRDRNTYNRFYVGLLSWPTLAAASGSWHPHVGPGNALQDMCTGGTELDDNLRGTQIRSVQDVLFVALQIKTMLSSYSMRGGPFATFKFIYQPQNYTISGQTTSVDLPAEDVLNLFERYVDVRFTPTDGGRNLNFLSSGALELRQLQVSERQLNTAYAELTRNSALPSSRIAPSPSALQAASNFLPNVKPVYIHDSFLFPSIRTEDPIFSQILPSEFGGPQTGAAIVVDNFRAALRRAG